MRPQLLTIGYEQHSTLASLIAVLKGAGVQRLLDVRELPLSRRRGFSKTALRDALNRTGIAYEHERALGNPKPLSDKRWGIEGYPNWHANELRELHCQCGAGKTYRKLSMLRGRAVDTRRGALRDLRALQHHLG